MAKNLIAIKARYLSDIVCPFQRKVFENSYSFISGPGMKETSIYSLHPDGSPMIPPKHTQSTLWKENKKNAFYFLCTYPL